MRAIVTIAIALISIVSPLAAFAVTAPITVPKAGGHYYWFVYTDLHGKQVQTTPKSFLDKKISVDLPLVKDAVPAKTKLYVLEVSSGNEAIVEMSPKKGEIPKLELKSGDFDRVRRVNVVVKSADSGDYVAAAIVKLEDGDKKVQTQTVDPSARGLVQFMDVPGGTAHVTVTYGEDRNSTQDVDIPLERKDIVPRIEVPVVGQVETVKADASAVAETDGKGEGTSDEDPAPTGGPSTAASLIQLAIGLVLLAVIVYGAHRLLRNRAQGFRDLLSKAGIQVTPDQQSVTPPVAAAPAPPADPTICPFCGGKKDPATGACACSVGPSADTPSQAASSGPRLVAGQGAYAGSIFTLTSGSMVIGREESNDIALPQDITVSRRHARISSENGDFKVYDEGSSNGTFVNGVKVTEHVLRPGDELQVGNTKLRFEP